MPRHSGDPFNRLYEGMLPFHENFRRSYASIQQVLPLSQSLSKRDLEVLLARGDQLCHHLEMHHHIEETYIFPLLAEKMPSFAMGESHRGEHQVMHDKLEEFQSYIKRVAQLLNSGPGKKALSDGAGQPIPEDSSRKPWPKEIYDGEKMKQIVDELGQALFPHLKAEEESLKAKSMRAHGWTEAEINRIPM
ncbi:unnamed protein product [Sympodiomycopsis kandeliae]